MPSSTSPSEVRVRVQVASRSRRTPSPASLRKWIRSAAAGPTDVTVRLVGPAEGRRLNLAYRGKDYATNVLTFTYVAGTGDIVLCPSVIAREAREQGKALEAHFAHLAIHAILHLRGYDHAALRDAARMEKAEIGILKTLGYPDPYAT